MNQSYYKKILIIISLVLTAFVCSTSITFAYWAEDVSGASNLSTAIVTIGQWGNSSQTPAGISEYDENTAYDQFDLVWYDGEIYEYRGYHSLGEEPSNANNWIIYNDINWYDTVTYYDGDIIYYNGIIYESNWENTNKLPGDNYHGAWTSLIPDSISWQPGQSTELYDVVYYQGVIYMYRDYYTNEIPGSTSKWQVYGDLTYSSEYVYQNGDVVIYNGNYYTTNNSGWANNSTPGSNNAWQQITINNWSTSVTQADDYVIHNGIIYQALTNSKSKLQNEPGTASSYGYWNAISTQEWQQYNVYENDDLVMYNGEVYELVNSNNSTVIPGTTQNSWNGAGTLAYSANTTYENGDFVIYNNQIYLVVNATNANLDAPGNITNAWNLISGYNWISTNTYYNGDLVLYNDTVYTAQTTTNETPGTSNDWNIASS